MSETTGLFKDATNDMAYLKAGFLGFQGSGKTRTSVLTAIGFMKYLQQLGLPQGNLPVYILDTETGSSWLIPVFRESGIVVKTAKTRAFADLLKAVPEAEKSAGLLMVDSITHFWREICDTYKKKKNITRLEFQHWDALKSEWAKFTDLFVNSSLHIILCGRAGYEYDYFENDNGKKELEKTGIKMKADSEMGYEPSLTVLMEREMDVQTKEVWRTAHILKDRSALLDGKSFRNPTFDVFLPHITSLNLGGTQVGVETRTSDALFTKDGETAWKYEQQQKAIALEEIQNELVKALPGQSGPEKVCKILILEKVFKTGSWAAIEAKNSVDLTTGLMTIRDILATPAAMETIRGEAEERATKAKVAK